MRTFLGPKFNRIMRFFVTGFPLDSEKVLGPGALALRAGLGGIPLRFAYTMAKKGGFSEVAPL